MPYLEARYCNIEGNEKADKVIALQKDWKNEPRFF